ncbi:MAG: 1-acyl-sn-glycerol-3-phosphate acyltransferase, partial [Sphaerochaetaceae bacterium]
YTGLFVFEKSGVWALAAMAAAMLAGAFQFQKLSSLKSIWFQRIMRVVYAICGFAVLFPTLPEAAVYVIAVVFAAAASWVGVNLFCLEGSASNCQSASTAGCTVFALTLLLVLLSRRLFAEDFLGILMVLSVVLPSAVFGCLLHLDDWAIAQKLGMSSSLSGREAVFDGQRSLRFWSLFKMKAPRSYLLLSMAIALGSGAIVWTIANVWGIVLLLVSFAAGSVVFGFGQKKAPRALLLIIAAAFSCISSIVLCLPVSDAVNSVMVSLLGIGLGGTVCLGGGYYSLAAKSMCILLGGFETSLLGGTRCFLSWLCFVAGALGAGLACGGTLILAGAAAFAFFSSKVLSGEQFVDAYLAEEEPSVVERESLIRQMIRRPDAHKLPPVWLYFFAGLVLKIMCRFKYGMRVVKRCRIPRPALILTNHASNFDYQMIGAACWPMRISFLSTYYWFTFRKLRPWLRYMGVIQKYQFATDITAMKKLKYVIQEKKGVTFIAPEGTVYANGKSGYINPSIVKIVKFLKVPVYAIKIEGAGLGHGKWQKIQQKNTRVELSMSALLSEDEVLNMDRDQMYRRIVDALHFDDFEFQKRTGIQVFGASKAEGLDDLLYLCPSCGKELALEAKGNTIRCTSCGLEATINDSYRFDWPDGQKKWFDNYSEWFDFQYNTLYEQMKANPDFEMSDPVVYRIDIVDTDGYVDSGDGVLTLSLKNGWTYRGTLLGQDIEEHDSLEEVPVAVMKMGTHIELPYKGHSRCFRFKDDGRISQKWHIASRVITEKILKDR